MAPRRRRPLRVKSLELLVPLKRGGMGEVWLARKKGAHDFSKLVAVKLMRPELAEHDEARAMFLDEAHVLSWLEHPAITQALDFGESAGTLYLVLEYVPGLSVARFMRKHGGPLDAGVAARMVAAVARGLHAVHEQTDEGGNPLDIVHRDISPQNLMVGFEGQMKLLDFGIALMAGRRARETTSGLVKGKIAYVAPEQIHGVGADRRSDVYSLCVVLHELLTGQTLFAARTSPLAAAEDRKRPPRPGRALRLPRGLERVVMAGLSDQPHRRPESAEALALELERIAEKTRAESLASFAARSLSTERRAHATWLRSLAVTEVAKLGPPPSDLEDEEIEVGSSQIVARASTRARRGWALAAGLAAVLGMGGWMLVRRGYAPAEAWWTWTRSALSPDSGD